MYFIRTVNCDKDAFYSVYFFYNKDFSKEYTPITHNTIYPIHITNYIINNNYNFYMLRSSLLYSTVRL